jgi:signal transduction histidine kinase
MDSSIVIPFGSYAPTSIAADGHDAAASASPLSELELLRERVRELAAEVVQAQEAVRRHVARELHDSVGAELTAARFAFANVETWLPLGAPPPCTTSLGMASRSLDAVCEAVRRALDDLHAPLLDAGLSHSLTQWIRSFGARTRLRVGFSSARDARFARLPADAALAIFRVAQESLNNVAKHAHASGADILIESTREHLTLSIVDDGVGLPASTARDRCYGIAGMRARCEAFDGELRITPTTREPSGHVQGTTVHARFAWNALLARAPRTARGNAAAYC